MQQTTAVRKTKGSKTFVEVTLGDGTTQCLGGKRAERANAVIIVTDAADGTSGPVGLRADVVKAEQEAKRLVRPTVKKWLGTFFDGVEQTSLSWNMVEKAKAEGVSVTHKQVTRTYQSCYSDAVVIRVQETGA